MLPIFRLCRVPLAGLILLASPAGAEVPSVAADIAPVHSLVARVMEGLGTPMLIVPGDASAHHHALRPSEAQSLQDAAAIFWVGPELTPWFGDTLASLSPDAHRRALIEAPGTRRLAFRTETAFDTDLPPETPQATAPGEQSTELHAEDEAPEGEDAHGDADDGHGHEGGIDPHAWLDPENAKSWLDLIAADLAELDPENAEAYRANATAGQAEIDSVIADIEERLAPLHGRPFLVYHDAFQYFERRFGLPASGAIAMADAADPSPARIAEMRDLAIVSGAACVLAEPQFKAGLVETVFSGGAVEIAVIDPAGAGLTPGPDLYPELLRAIADKLATCL